MEDARHDRVRVLIETDAKEEAARVLSLAWGRADPVKQEMLRRHVHTFLRERPMSFHRVAWVRKLNTKVVSVPNSTDVDEAVWGFRHPCVFAVDGRSTDYQLGAALVAGSFGSTYIVLLDPVASLDLIFCVVLGAMNVCGQGGAVYISLDVCDLATQNSAARTFPVSQLCKYEDVYHAVIKALRVKMKPGFHATSSSTCTLRKYLKNPGTSHDRAQWFESELGTLAILLDRGAFRDHVTVVFELWCEEAHTVLRSFLKSKVREKLVLYLQSDGDTGPDWVNKSDILFRMRKVKTYRPLCAARLSADAEEDLLRNAPVMCFEGSETIVHCLAASAARRLFPEIFTGAGDADVMFIALSKTYSHVISYAIGVRDAAATTIVDTSKHVIDELWYAMYQFENLPLQATGLVVPNEHEVERLVVCLSRTGAAFMREFVSRYHYQPLHKQMVEFYRIDLARPHVLEWDQGVLLDRNCWKRLAGYVGMTPASRLNDCLRSFSIHPNLRRLIAKPGSSDWANETTVVTALGDVLFYILHDYIREDGLRGSHMYTVDDPNYKYMEPHFDYAANDAWFEALAAQFPADKALFDRIGKNRRRLKIDAGIAAAKAPPTPSASADPDLSFLSHEHDIHIDPRTLSYEDSFFLQDDAHVVD